jgi:hypothetical protein
MRADLMNTLWEADVVVFKAHITTGPGGKVLDMFWIYDNRCELPENHRCASPLAMQSPCTRRLLFPIHNAGLGVCSSAGIDAGAGLHGRRCGGKCA